MIKRSMAIVLCLCMLFSLLPISVRAAEVVASGKCGANLTWEIQDGVLTIKGTGAMDNYSKSEAPWNEYRDSFSSLVIEEGVTSIGENAFYKCSFLSSRESITIPSTIRNIYENGFSATNNAKVYITDLSAWCNITFHGHTSNPVSIGGLYLNGEMLTQVVVPSDVTSLDSGVFYSYDQLVNVIIPAQVKIISGDVFYDCSGLDAVVFLGDAPKFVGEFIFRYTDTMVYYPAGNETWTPEVMGSYGGELNWQPYELVESLDFIEPPVGRSAYIGDYVTYNAVALGEDVSYQWQFSPRGSDTWTDMEEEGADTPRLRLRVEKKWDGRIRCLVEDGAGNTNASEPAELIIKSTLCIDHTPMMVDNTFRYLDEVYIEKYPEMATRSLYGTEKDNEILQILADVIAEGCETDREKADAVYEWIRRNVDYVDNSVYPIDAFLDRKGHCLGYAELMQDVLRKMGIPAVVSAGWRGDMATRRTEKLFNLAGHAWCFVYLDGEWLLFDPGFNEKGISDREYIAKWYYITSVEWVLPVYDPLWMPPIYSNEAVCYTDGKFVLLNVNGERTKDIGRHTEFSNNLENRFNVFIEHDINEWLPADVEYDASQRIHADVVAGVGWFRDGRGKYQYIYENGLVASNTMVELEGKKYYITESDTVAKVELPEEDLFTINGQLAVPVGYQGPVLTPMYFDNYDASEFVVEWYSMNQKCVTVDDNGNITALQAGSTYIEIIISRPGSNGANVIDGFELTVYKTERVADYSDSMRGHKHTYTTIIRNATCEREGYVIHTCTFDGCADSYIGDYTESLGGHSFTEYISDENATLTEDGTKTSHCDRDGCDETDTIQDIGSMLQETGIRVVAMPTKRTYQCGEAFSNEGMVVELSYSDGSTRTLTLTEYRCVGYDPKKVGSQTIRVIYGTLTAMLTVEVFPSETTLEPEETNQSPTLLAPTVPEEPETEEPTFVWPVVTIAAACFVVAVLVWNHFRKHDEKDLFVNQVTE